MILYRKLNCPAQDSGDNHHIKLKELVRLKLEENEHKEYICWLCKKPLVHQKICALRKCGHVMCKDCVFKFCKSEKNEMMCSVCDVKFD